MSCSGQVPDKEPRHQLRGSANLCTSICFELRIPLPVVAMQTCRLNLEGAGKIPLRRLVKKALRMRPSRIVVGEVRQEECLDRACSA